MELTGGREVDDEEAEAIAVAEEEEMAAGGETCMAEGKVGDLEEAPLVVPGVLGEVIMLTGEPWRPLDAVLVVAAAGT